MNSPANPVSVPKNSSGSRRSILRLGFLLSAFFALTWTPLLRSDPELSPTKADLVVILKKDHLLELHANGKVVRTYLVALGRGGLAPKQKEGDALTPEGHYVIDARNADSRYHKALHVSYPNAEDRKRAAKLGAAPGGAIMIHGLPNGRGFIGSAHRLYDWTLGCIAVTDSEIDEIWTMVPIGTPVEIKP